ncbi:MAG: hypothetical protein ACT4RN_04590 [Pseudonocardia sp.]
MAGRPLLSGELGEQVRAGWRLDQVDSTTCGSAVLLAVAAWADPDELARLDGPSGVRKVARGRVVGFGARYDARQLQVHRESNRFWPRALGTTPWAMAAWLRRHVPAAGRYRVRLVDDVSTADAAAAVAAVTVVLDAGRPVPLLVGTLIPRHYVLAVGRDARGWRVYEPSSGSVRPLDPDLVAARALRPALGWDRLHAALLPS